jgi:hypothetical protein
MDAVARRTLAHTTGHVEHRGGAVEQLGIAGTEPLGQTGTRQGFDEGQGNGLIERHG